MKTEPIYISQKLRSEQAWAKTGEKLGFPAATIREMYLHRWCGPISSGDFHDLVARGRITRENCLEDDTEEAAEKRIAASKKTKGAKLLKHLDDDSDCLDRISFGLKGVLQIGDEIEATETKWFLSKRIAYITKGKRYRITAFQDKGFGNFTVITTTNLPAPDDKHWESNYGIRRLFRKGVLIWDWKAAWIRDWDTHHPEKPYPKKPSDKRLFKRLNW